MKLLQINIEGDKHIDTVTDFILRENPDVICMQEVFESQFESFKTEFKMNGVFVGLNIRNGRALGTAIYCKNITGSSIEYYWKQTADLRAEDDGSTPFKHAHCSLLSAQIPFGGKIFNVITTHFPVHYPGYEVSDFQKECFARMRSLLETKHDLILSGDTNCPRGTEIFDTLATMYKDNIPKEAVTTIDENLHRVGFLPYVIDCLFTTKDYNVTNVKLVSGVSDHLGIVAEIER